ncbi:translocation/assembly module TamB [Vibrio sp. ZSDE26]|uniref:Translocation/assembly module TamB n=1 Tax=Vibrio amylolyticus TaxID=2847292 RepID=A0A9X2BGP2_9VIBR|nr:translocation/assembly module TamB domain-containing protein [Vibrio amylolyticus]MCK6263091.1 translocation/assembly module TamB [Vibrio amylolyticus]
MTKIVLKWSKWLSITFISIVVLLLLLVITLLYTNVGLNVALWGAQQALPQLQVDHTKGAIFPRFTLNQVKFQDDDLFIDLQAKSLTLAINPSCFLEPSICINELAIDGLDFSMPQLPESEKVEPQVDDNTKPLRISTPIPIQVRHLGLSNINLDILGNQVRWESLTTGARFQNNRLRLTPTLWNDISLSLASSSEEEGAPQAQAKTEVDEDKSPIELPPFIMPLSVVIERFDVSEFTLEQESPVVVNHLGLIANASGSDVAITSLALTMPEVEAALAAEITLQNDYPLKAQLSAEVKHPQAKGQKVSLTVDGSVANLAIDSDFSGLIKASLKAELQPLKSTLPYSILLSDAQAQWPLSGKADYQVAIERLSSSGGLEGYDLDLIADVKGSSFPEVSLKAKGDGNLEQIKITEIHLETLDGTIDGEVFASWNEPINWQGKLYLDHIQPGLYWPEAEGNISGDIHTQGSLTSQGGWITDTSVIDIDGILRDYPLNIEGSLLASDEKGSGAIHIQTPSLILSHGPNSIEARGALKDRWNMQVGLSIPEIAKSVPDLNGAVIGDVSLSGQLSEPSVSLSLTANDLAWQDEATVKLITLSGDIKPLPEPTLDLHLQANTIQYQENIVDDVDLKLSGSLDEHELLLDVQSDLISTSLAISGAFEQQPIMKWGGELERLLLTTEQGPWALNKATKVNVNIDEQQAFVEAHCWIQSDSSICLDDDINVGKQGEAQLSIHQFSFTQLAAFMPQDTAVEGVVNAQANAKWGEKALPEVSVQVQMPAGQVTSLPNAPLSVGWDSVSVNARLADNQLEANWLLDLTDNGELSGDVIIPNIDDPDKQIEGDIRISKIALAFLSPIIGEYNKFDAQVNSHLELSGDLTKPNVEGELRVEDLQLRGELSPLDIQGGKIIATFAGTSAELLANIDTPDGPLNIEGNADWRDLEAWSSNIRVFANELLVSQPPMVSVKVSPDMTISLAPQHAKVTGTIDLPWGNIVVKDLPPSAIGVSKDQILLDENLHPIEDSGSGVFAIETDIKITIGDEFALSAFGLEGNLVGQLNVTQKDKGPIIHGEINIVDGAYRSFGQDLMIDEGKILMNGPVDQPYVSISAIRNPENTRDDVVAGVRVDGPAEEPTVTIFSEPAMPQANALSYLLRGQDIDAETGGNAMTTTLIGLSLAKSGKVVGEIGEAFGVQDLQLDTAGSGEEAQVTVSGYILPGLQVKYGVGIFDSIGEFTVRYRLMNDLYLEVLSGVDNAVDLLYQFEFE